MQLPAPFGKYELLERIATGGMAEVYLARSFGVAGFEKRLVIKRIRPELAQDPRFIQMFINEAKIGVHLNHPNVVQTYDLGKVGTSWFMAMEHLHGRDLNKLVKVHQAAEARVPIDVAVAIVAEALRGLAYAHGRTDADGSLLGLVHRDVSPHNLIVTFTGEVKLVDFGVARLMNTESARAVGKAEPGRPGGGKYAYMSPEQARSEPLDNRTDVFSAGIVLWELIVGHRLYQDPDPAVKLQRVLDAVVAHPRDEGIEIDEGLWTILQTALARDRNDRYASAALFEEDLRAWMFDSGLRVGRAAIASAMRDAFPDDADRSPDDLELQRMVADVERMGGIDNTVSYPTPADTSTRTPLPSRMRPGSGETKTVAVLVVDVDGFTDMSARVDPEVLFKRHYQLLRWLRRIVDRYGGLVQRAIDDHVIIFFGVPRTRVDDLQRAVECALELQREVGRLRGKGMQLELAIGVHSGEVTVGSSRGKIRYTARGDTTRLARRLSAVADHGQTLLSERVVQKVEAWFRLRRGPDVPNRGGAGPEPAFLVDGRRRGLRIAGKGPWMRRGRELQVIRDALQELANGKGRSVLLCGAVGTGKSRLVSELRDLAQRRGVPLYLGRCKPWGEDPPLEPIRDLLRDVVGLEADASADEVRVGLERISQLGLADSDIAAVQALFGLRKPPRGTGIAEAWRAAAHAIDGLAADGPVIVAFEDVHFLEARELHHLVTLAHATTSSGRVMILLTHRGEDDSAPLDALDERVVLGAFDASGQRRLMQALLEVEHVDPALTRLVQRACEGNPLYLEEMVKYLMQQGAIRCEEGRADLVRELPSNEIPSGLAGLVAARIDALDPASKGALQLASILGLSFSGLLLGAAMGLDDPTPVVTDLAGHGLIVREEEQHGDAWVFASTLVREAAYRGILGVQRRDYHRMVATAIETLHEHDLDSWREVLAAHCAEGGRPMDATRYAYEAGQDLEERQYLERALACYERGLRWVGQVPTSPDTWDQRVQGEAMLQFRAGAICTLLGDTQTAERRLQVALDIASDAGLPWIEIRAHLHLARVYMARGRIALAEAHVGQARSLARFEEDQDLKLEVLEAAANLAHEQGRNEDSESLWAEASELSRGDPRALARCQLGMSSRRIREGELESARTLLEEALVSTRVAGDRILEGRVLNNIGLLHYWTGEPEEALRAIRSALEVREGIGYSAGVVINHHNIGDVHFSRGDFARAYVAFARSRELAAEMRWERGVALNEVYLGYIDAIRGGREEGLARIEAATASARTLGDGEIATNGEWLCGRLLMHLGEPDLARLHLERALAEARRYGLDTMVPLIEDALRDDVEATN